MNNSLSPVPQKLSKKEARKLIYEKLAGALADFKPSFKEKKFESNLKRASKLFAADLAKTAGRKKEKPAKEGKKKKGKKDNQPSPEVQTSQA